MAKLRRYLTLLAVVPCLWTATAEAAMVYLKARLDGPQAGVPTTADGAAFLTYDTGTKLLTWTVSYRNLTSAANAAHIHGPGGPGVIAAIVVPFTLTASPITGSATITAPQEADMLAGLWYVNIHSDNYPGGEIRGQISVIDTTLYSAPMDGTQAGTLGSPIATSGSGGGTVTFNPATMLLSWNLTWSNLPSGVTAAHFHGPAQAFEVAAVEVPSALGNPMVGSMTLTPELAAQLVNGFMYFNIHTNDDPGGEIRGQVTANENPPRLLNISTRGKVLTGFDVMIGGFVLSGPFPKTVVVRAIGPSLTGFGVAGALANPTMQLVRQSDGATIATNDNWGSAANAAQIMASGFAPSNALESAVLMTLDPGAYTAIVSGAGNGTGVGLVEVYEVDRTDTPMINISTRGRVLTGGDVMIGGFVVTGNQQRTVVIRAIGPSLANFGVTGALADPTMKLVRISDGATIATNDNWGDAPNAAQITASGFAPTNPLESAILVTLDPGAYTAIVTGVGGGTGTGLVEVYQAQ